MYAFVRFFEDDMCYALPVSSVEDFSPLHQADFDNQKVYLVHRAERNGSAGQPCEAQILALAGKSPPRHVRSARSFLPSPPGRFDSDVSDASRGVSDPGAGRNRRVFVSGRDQLDCDTKRHSLLARCATQIC